MHKKRPFIPVVLIVLAPVAAAQTWEFGGGAGAGFYSSQDVKTSAGSGSVKITTGPAASVWIANDNGRLWGGELRYDYQAGDLQVSSGATKATFGAQTHGIHYDFVLHTAPRNAKVRPFVAFGAGVKQYRGSGTEVASQPLNQLALLTKTTEMQPMASVGAGVKFNLHRIGFRMEVHDFMTPFPSKVITPAQNSSIGGWMHDLMVDFGVSFLF